MSWLNFNESLNTIKGQLSTFASGVLAEGIVTNSEDDLQRNHVGNSEPDKLSSNPSKQPTTYNDNNWIWESPTDAPNKRNNLIHDLQTKVDILENEKKDLVNSLEQLDADHQHTTQKLVSLKDNLQIDYNDLKLNFEKLKKEYGEILHENMEKTKQIDSLQTQSNSEQLLNDNELELEKLTPIENLQKEMGALRLECKKHVEELQDAANDNEKLKKSNNAVKNEGELLQNANKLLIQELALVTNNRDAIQESYRLINDQKEELLQKLQDLTLAYESMKMNGEDHLVTDNDSLLEHKRQLTVAFEKSQNDNQQMQKLCDELKHKHSLMQDNLEAIQMERLSEKEEFNEKLHNLILQNQDLNCLQEKLKSDLRTVKEHEAAIQNLKELYEKTRKEKQTLHEKYLSIITDCMKKYTEVDAAISPITSDEQPQILEFASEVETLLKLLVDFKSKTETLEKEICRVTREKNKVIAEKNFEIEKLLQNSEILSQEVIAKTHAIKDYEDECGELMKNNDLLIQELQNFKNSRLQTISESNEDNMLLMESQLDNANRRIQDMELIITDLENSKQETNVEIQTELDYIKRQLNITGQELSKSKVEHQDMLTSYSQLEKDRDSLKLALDKIKLEYENIEYKYTEVNIGLESLREENEEFRRKIATLETKYKQLEHVNVSLENNIKSLRNTIDDQQQSLNLSIESNVEKDAHIHHYVERLQNSKMTETGLKLQVDTISKELQSALEAKQTIEAKCKNIQDEHEDKEMLQKECAAIKSAHSQLTQTHNELQQNVTVLEAQLFDLSQSRNELIAALTTKHEENVTYHAEIQRLSAIGNESVPSEQLERKNVEIEKLTDQNGFLREKCEVLAQNLLQEQSNVQKILSEHSSASEKEQSLTKELERLRVHLVEVEEMYTQELVQAEQRNKEMQAKVNEIEQREKNSSSIYTSVSIRANQQVETLQTQLQLVSNQRDELRVKISDMEDENNKHVAALTNLQFVLEQFQRDKDKDVHQETERIRRQITVEKKIQDDLRSEKNNLKLQLDESKQGLQAAARLTDQLEKCKKQIINLKDEVSKLQEKLYKSESSNKELSTQSDLKVDKTLIKNLIIGYISSNVNDQNQILKIIATVLDFNKKESDKVHLNKSHAGWLSSILHPQGLNTTQDMTQQSLSAAFVRFLENESKPKVLPNLLTSSLHAKSESSSSTSSTPLRQSPHVLSEVVLPTFVDFGKNRNSSSILKDVLKDNT